MARRRGKTKRTAWAVLIVVALVAVAWGGWGAFRVGPEVDITMETDRPAIGPGTEITVRFAEPGVGFDDVVLEVEQGACKEHLASLEIEPKSPFRPFGAVGRREAGLAAMVGKDQPECLQEGEATLRAVATRITGPLRGTQTTVEELTLPVRFRAPRLELLSGQHYVRQGGSGAVAFRVEDVAVSSGVRVGEHIFTSFPMPGGGKGEHFTLFGIPWNHVDEAQVRAFAEDAAGNRVELPFLTKFTPKPPKRDTIRLPDSFLQRVVPAIASQEPDFDGEGSLLDQYLWINNTLRQRNRALIAQLSTESVPDRLWDGDFLQLPNSQRMAGFAETRTYLYDGKSVDEQTHLGLDFASVTHAEVPAPNAGRVLHTGYVGIYGNVVVLDHGQGLVSVSAHLSRIDVEEGQSVTRGQLIGLTGATGLAGGDHLHFGIFIQGVAVDPIEWLDGRWIRHRILPRIEAASSES